MRKKYGVLLAALFSVGAVSGVAGDLTLADKGASAYQIVIPDGAPSQEIGQWMTNIARLVQTAFQTNGFEIGVVSESQRETAKPGLYLGDTAFARAHGVHVARFTDWTHVHKVVGRDVIIAGLDRSWQATPPTNGWRGIEGHPRLGTLKAVTAFLRQYAGTRFLYPTETGIEYLPVATIAVPSDLDKTYTPALKFNYAYAAPDDAYRIANNYFFPVDGEIGVHTWDRAIPAEKYRETHPEYFAFVNGKRCCETKDYSGRWTEQYCISNPDVQELIYRDIRDRADRGFNPVGLGQPDGFQPCQCEPCLKLFDTGTDWEEKIWILHRNLAERLRKERPGTKVVLMSYGHTWVPPKTFKKFPDNAIVMWCRMTPEILAQWSACEVPGGFIGYLYIWGTYNMLAYTPQRTPVTIEALTKKFHALRLQGIYLDGFGQAFGLEGPNYYLFGRMFDDPETLRAKDILEEFYEGAFREAAMPMRRFYDALYHAIQFSCDMPYSYEDVGGTKRSFFRTDDQKMKLMALLYSPDVLAELETHLGQAEKRATSPKVRARLALVRIEFDYARHIATVAHLHNAYRVAPRRASRDQLLDAIDGWHAFLAKLYTRNADGSGDGWLPGMRRGVIAGWPDFSPFLGHSRHAVALTRWYKDTPLNWNTAEMRKSPLPGVKRLVVARAGGPVTLDAAAWNSAPSDKLEPVPGRQPSAGQATSVRALYDRERFYLRVESALPAGAGEFAPAVRDGQPAQAESLDIAIAPLDTRDKFYRFVVGPAAEPRYDAAHGFIDDTLHPLYGKDDPGWRGEWTYETRLEPEKNRWVAMLAIPFKTLGVAAPVPGVAWRGNLGRLHVPGTNPVERSLWSIGPQATGSSDPEAMGEIVFDDGTAGAGVPGWSPVRKAREDLYRASFEIPPEWTSLTNRLPASAWGAWRFREDPADKGGKEGWAAPDLNDAGWMPIEVPAFWAESDAGAYTGYGWYRVTLAVPAEWKGHSLRLLFGAADEQAWVYVNGRLAGEHTAESAKTSAVQLWDKPFVVEVQPDQLTFGGKNVLAVRVHNSAINGGLWRPVLAQRGGIKP